MQTRIRTKEGQTECEEEEKRRIVLGSIEIDEIETAA